MNVIEYICTAHFGSLLSTSLIGLCNEDFPQKSDRGILELRRVHLSVTAIIIQSESYETVLMAGTQRSNAWMTSIAIVICYIRNPRITKTTTTTTTTTILAHHVTLTINLYLCFWRLFNYFFLQCTFPIQKLIIVHTTAAPPRRISMFQ